MFRKFGFLAVVAVMMMVTTVSVPAGPVTVNITVNVGGST